MHATSAISISFPPNENPIESNRFEHWPMSSKNTGVLKIVCLVLEFFAYPFISLMNLCLDIRDGLFSIPAETNEDPITKLAGEKLGIGPASQELNARPNTPVQKEVDKFYKFVNQCSFVEGLLGAYESYLSPEKIEKLEDKKLLKYYYSEISGIQSEIQELYKNKEFLAKLQFAKLLTVKIPQHDIDQISGICKKLDQLSEKCDSLLQILKNKIAVGHQVIGLYNVGNTCYMNSALQALLAVENFIDLIPSAYIDVDLSKIEQKKGESDSKFKDRKEKIKDRQEILKLLVEFIKAQKSKKSPVELGYMVGNFRKRIFESKFGGQIFLLGDGGLTSMKDAVDVIRLIINLIGLNYQLEEIQSFKLPAGLLTESGRDHKINRKVFPNDILNLYDPNGSIQDKINTYGSVKSIKLPKSDDPKKDNGLRWENPADKKTIKLYAYEESLKILGEPKDVMVVRTPCGIDYFVDPEQDGLVDFAKLFKGKDHPVEYELVGICQNHNEHHWTSIVKSGDQWKSCNDDYITDISPTDEQFTHFPAHLLVYRRVKSS